MSRQTQKPQSWGLVREKIQRSLTEGWSRRDSLSIMGSYLLMRTQLPVLQGEPWGHRRSHNCSWKDSNKQWGPLFRAERTPPNNSLNLFSAHACTGKSWKISFHSLLCTFSHIISFKINNFTSEIVDTQKPRWDSRGQGGDMSQPAELFLLSPSPVGGVCFRPASSWRQACSLCACRHLRSPLFFSQNPQNEHLPKGPLSILPKYHLKLNAKHPRLPKWSS